MINNFRIGKVNFDGRKVILIAEAGVNHNGSLKIAEKLIREAKNSGADIIKFQTYKASKLVVKKSKRFWSWTGERKQNGTQHDSYSKLDSFNINEYLKLKRLCDKYKIEFLSTPFDEESVMMLKKIGVKGFKIASCDITNFQLLKAIGKTKLPVLISTGASSIEEIQSAVNLIKKYHKKIGIMHCTLCYPTKVEDSNLSAILDLKKNFNNFHIGLSDHTLGYEIGSGSVLFGATFIEKHFTYNKKLKKSADHWLSINHHELKKMRKLVNIYFQAIGVGVKKILRCEVSARKLARRSIVLKNSLNANSKIKKEDLILKRPGTGIPPKYINQIIGKKIKNSKKEDTILKFSDLTSKT